MAARPISDKCEDLECMSTEYLTVEQIARELGMSEETVLRWIRKKQLKAYKFGRDYRVKREDYQEFLNLRYTGNVDEE
jgi:excisionase family DNA binding protein